MQKEAERAVSKALEADDVQGALANVDTQLRFPDEASKLVLEPVVVTTKTSELTSPPGRSVTSLVAFAVCM